MKSLIIITSLALSACTSSGLSQIASGYPTEPITCEFDFHSLNECNIIIDKQNMAIRISSMAISEDELQLTHLVLDKGYKTIALPLSHNVSIMPGDRGYVLVEDINFDQRPDIGISTSFGVANAYLDYWVTSENAEQFHYVGNFPRLEVDSKTQTLSATVRVSAANYENKRWRWEDQELVQIAAP